MSKVNVIEQLQENIKVIYRKAVDADEQLELFVQLKKRASHKFLATILFLQTMRQHLPLVRPFQSKSGATVVTVWGKVVERRCCKWTGGGTLAIPA